MKYYISNEGIKIISTLRKLNNMEILSTDTDSVKSVVNDKVKLAVGNDIYQLQLN